MKVIKATQQMLETRTLVLGFQGENLRTQLRIDCSPTFAEYPNATPALAVKPSSGETYPVFVERDGNEVVWDIVANNLVLKGDGEMQLTFHKGDVIAKTVVGHIRVNRSLQIDGEMPDVVATWIENANRKLAEVDAQIVELEGMVDTATDAATRAEQSASTASMAAEQAAGSAATATAKATEATTAAGTATAKAAEAGQSALTASTKASEAAESERISTLMATEASQSAQTASSKASDAAESQRISEEKAQSAQTAESNAQDAKDIALRAKQDAEAAQIAAEAAKTAAEGSAGQAATSAQNAGTAAQTATQKATEASQSATNAATFAGTATTKAEEAAESAQAASDAKTAVEQTAEQLADSLEQISQNTQDIADHEQEYNALKAATLIHNTASGAIASFSDGAEMPVDEVTVQINPVQDLHGQDSPWPAGGGKNKLPNENGTYKGTTGNNIYIVDSESPVSLPAGTYYIKYFADKSTGLAFAGFYLSINGGTASRVGTNHATQETVESFVLAEQSNITLRLYSLTTGFNEAKYRFMLTVEDSTNIAFSPYSNICPITGWDGVQIVVSPTTDAADGQTYSITLPTEAGTVYGGSLTIAEDGSGTLTVDRACVTFDGTEVWSTTAAYCYRFGYLPSTRNGGSTQIGSHFVTTYIYNAGNSLFAQANGAIVKSNATDTVALATYLAEQYANGTPVQLCYPLATPITYTLTASEVRTLLGQNNVWSDAGDVSVKYKADTKLYIDGKIAELVAQIVNS